mgnify:CR=1 FL=1
MISEELAQFLQSGLSIHVATRDAALAPGRLALTPERPGADQAARLAGVARNGGTTALAPGEVTLEAWARGADGDSPAVSIALGALAPGDSATFALDLPPLRLHLEAADRGRCEIIDIAVKAFELSQSLRSQWFTADYAAKRRIVEIICLNWKLDGVSLIATMRKPFDMIAEGLIWKNSRGERIRTFDLLVPNTEVCPRNAVKYRDFEEAEIPFLFPIW